MTRTKKTFGIIFIVLLMIMSIFVLSLYDNVRENIPKNENIAYALDDNLKLFTIAMAKELDPNYEAVTFDENVDQETRDIFLNLFNKCLDDIKVKLKRDSDFVYQITNTVTAQNIFEHTDKIKPTDDQSKYSFYSHIIYDNVGRISAEGDLSSNLLEDFNIADILESYTYRQDNSYIYIDSWLFNINDIKINIPNNLDITYIIPASPTNQGFASQYVNSWENYNYFSVSALLGGTTILIIFLLFYPIRIVEAVNPFLSVKKWKAEINFLLLTTLITFAVTGCMVVSGFSLNNYLLEILNRYNISYSDVVLQLVNFGVWMLTFLIISLGIFQIKYIFAHGLWRYLKENTLVGGIIRGIKNKLNRIAEIDLSKPLQRVIMKYVLINFVIVMVITTFWGFGYILAIIYTFVCFFWIKDKVIKVQQDYDKLLNATKELSKGNFDVEINSDVGIFNALNDEFKNIRIGFAEAVKEETKSQNMKNELISNVSHDLKTPLTCIKNYIVLLNDDNLSSTSRHEYLNNLNQYTNRLTNLIEDLFEVSKVNSGNIKLDIVELNLIALLEQAQAECNEILESRDLKIIPNYPYNELLLQLDGDKTYRVFENLFTNISKYALSNSRVYVDLIDNENEIKIVFKNISQEQMNFSPQEITERFVRGDKSRHESGSGLGLAIAKSFIEAQGGKFDIDIDGDLFKAIVIFKKVA